MQLTLNPTSAVSHFAHIPGVYDHWSVLCQAEGTFTTGDNRSARPRRTPLHRAVYIRDVDGAATTHTRGYEHTVHEYSPDQLTTPDGHKMRMPKRFAWRVASDNGADLITIDGTSSDDFAYGLGTGYAGSYHYVGRFRETPITGTGYIEWIDRR